MEIIKNVIDDVCEIKLVGRLDTTTAPELETALKEVLEASTKNLQIDLEQLDYISSAGLRVLVKAHKAMKDRGGVRISHCNSLVTEVFKLTGFLNVFRFE